MDLQNKLIELSNYNVTFNVANGNFIVRIRYDEKWDVIEPENNKIAFYRDETDSFLCYYVAPISINIDEIFHAIDETIEYNHELEEKVFLFNEKMKELQVIFAKEPISVLKTMEFKMKRKKQKKDITISEVQNEEKTETLAERKNDANTEDDNSEISEIDGKINAVLGE